jgi:hypothetical protein
MEITEARRIHAKMLRSTRYGKHNLYLMNRQFWVCRTVGLELWRATFVRSETCSRSRIAYRRRHHRTRTPTASHQDVSDIVASLPADYAVGILRRRRRTHNRSLRRGPGVPQACELECRLSTYQTAHRPSAPPPGFRSVTPRMVVADLEGAAERHSIDSNVRLPRSTLKQD